MEGLEHPDAVDSSGRDLVITRTLLARPERVFAAWMDPDQLARWWGPQGFSSTIHEFEPEAGGTWRFVMHGPDGSAHSCEFRFVEIDAPGCLVLDQLSEPRFRMSVDFESADGDTWLTLRMRFASAAECEAAKGAALEGSGQAFDRLAALLAED